MPRFKVGDRVKIVGPSISGCKGGLGQTATIQDIESGKWFALDGESAGRGKLFEASSIEPAPQFKVGDEVRVKTGSPEGTCNGKPYSKSFGVMLKVKEATYPSYVSCVSVNPHDVIDPIYLEPWNPAEEWNGSAWVKREVAKPAIVAIRRDQGKHWAYTEVCSSTNEAFRKAEEFAATSPGTEYVVYQEKGSRRVEKKSKTDELADRFKGVHSTYDGTLKMEYTTESVKVVGDEVIVAYKVKS